MIDKDYRYYIHAQKNTRIHRRTKKLSLWIIALGGFSVISAGFALTFYGQEPPAHPTHFIEQSDRPTPSALPSPQQTQAPIKKEKTATQTVTRRQSPWQNITVKKGDSLAQIFSRVGLSPRQLHKIMSLGATVQPLAHLQPGQLLQLDLTENTAQRQLAALRLNFNPVEYLEVRVKGDRLQARRVSRETEAHTTIVTGTIRSSLSEAGFQAGLTHKQVMELVQIFGRDINFASDLRVGDSFRVLFKEHYLKGRKVKNSPILAAEFTNQGKTYRAIRYSYGNSHTGYYTPKGVNKHKTFLRAPVSYTRISSPFNLHRRHPILHTIRPHEGVDYAAPIGTPVKASSKGSVVFVGHKEGYGKTIVLQHGAKYSTLYGHLSHFKDGLEAGTGVKRGEIIGYVGESGLATGPHLHYEFRINDVPRNPVTVKLPQADPIPTQYMQDFQRRSASLIAQLDTAETTAVALSQ